MIDTQLFFICIGGLVFVILCVFGYILSKDKETTKRIVRFESAIEAVAKEIYKIQKTQQKIQDKQNNVEFLVSSGGDAHNDTNEKIASINKKIISLGGDIENVKNNLDEKILGLENRVKEYGPFNTTSSGGDIDEKKIVDMFQNGFSIDSIAKELRIGRGEVEFTLKLANIK